MVIENKGLKSLNKKLDKICDSLERIAEALESNPKGGFDTDNFSESRFEEEKSEIPKGIKNASVEELAKKLSDFIKKEFPDQEKIYVRSYSNMFWEQMNFQKWGAPANIQLKIEKAEMKAQDTINKEKEDEIKKQLEIEKIELPKLVDKCIGWALERGLKRVTKSDVDVFLMEHNKEILPQIKNQLYAISNVEIKSKK